MKNKLQIITANDDMPHFPYLLETDGLVFFKNDVVITELAFWYYEVCVEEPLVQSWQSIVFTSGNEIIYCLQ